MVGGRSKYRASRRLQGLAARILFALYPCACNIALVARLTPAAVLRIQLESSSGAMLVPCGENHKRDVRARRAAIARKSAATGHSLLKAITHVLQYLYHWNHLIPSGARLTPIIGRTARHERAVRSVSRDCKERVSRARRAGRACASVATGHSLLKAITYFLYNTGSTGSGFFLAAEVSTLASSPSRTWRATTTSRWPS